MSNDEMNKINLLSSEIPRTVRMSSIKNRNEKAPEIYPNKDFLSVERDSFKPNMLAKI